MNWLDRARHEIGEKATGGTANRAERGLTAVTAVPHPAFSQKSAPTNGCNGSERVGHLRDSESLREAFEERAAIMEFDGGLSREEAEAAALDDLLGPVRAADLLERARRELGLTVLDERLLALEPESPYWARWALEQLFEAARRRH